MSASEPAIAVRDIRCPRCFSQISQVLTRELMRWERYADVYQQPQHVECPQHNCDWSGTVIWAEIVEAKETT